MGDPGGADSSAVMTFPDHHLDCYNNPAHFWGHAAIPRLRCILGKAFAFQDLFQIKESVFYAPLSQEDLISDVFHGKLPFHSC